MISKLKSFLSNHPRMRIVVIIAGAISVFSIAMHVMNHKKEPIVKHELSSVSTQSVPLNNKLGKSLSHAAKIKNMSSYLDRQASAAKKASGNSIMPGDWFKSHKDSIVKKGQHKSDDAKNKENTAEAAKINQPKVPIAASKTKVVSSNTNKIISDINHKVMSPSAFVKAMKLTEKASVNNNHIRQGGDLNSYNNPRYNTKASPTAMLRNMQRPMTQKERMAADHKSQHLHQLASAMKSELDASMQGDNITRYPSFNTLNQKEDTPVLSKAQAAQNKAAQDLANPKEIIKAGTIYFAVTTNMVSSDQATTPSLATIETGPYRGAKLIGGFNKEGDKLVMRFSTMVTKDRKKSFGIGTAYAIDTRDGQLAVQTGVNHHYLMRFGSLLAGSFLKGVGDAVTPPKNTICISSGQGGCINSDSSDSILNKMSPGQVIGLRGVGEVGSKLGDHMRDIYNTPTTVTVNKGTMIGILFMHDVTLPKRNDIAVDADYVGGNSSQLDFLKDGD